MVPYDRSLLTKQQLYGNKHKNCSYQPEPAPFNDVQQFLYRKALYGLAVYKPDHVVRMDRSEKFETIRMQQKAQHVINVFKITMINQWVKSLFSKMFWNSEFAEEFVDEKYDDYNEVCNMSFKDLGITKHMIAQKLVEANVLPDNFFQMEAA